MYDYRKDVKPDCIISTHSPHISGYVQINRRGNVQYQHRLVYAKVHGLTIYDIQGKIVRHKCDCRQCINPDHLEIGTLADNAKDTADRGRAKGLPRPGAANPANKYSPELIAEIRANARYGATELAKRFPVSRSQIYRIIHNQSWKGTTE